MSFAWTKYHWQKFLFFSKRIGIRLSLRTSLQTLPRLFLALGFLIMISRRTLAADTDLTTPPVDPNKVTWSDFEKMELRQERYDRINGISYIVSGSIGVLGGVAGALVTKDPLEQGIYSLFQTIGIASIGYGTYKWKVGDDNRHLLDALRDDKHLTEAQRTEFLRAYYREKEDALRRENNIRALTHGLIAGLNFYNGSQLNKGGVKNALYFVGVANLLACISYSF